MEKVGDSTDLNTTDLDQILVVDDDVSLRRLVRDYLSSEGYVVHEARDVAAMRLALTEQNVGIVILDVLMPGEDGLSAARSLQYRPDLGIIMVSALGSEKDRIAGLEYGADDYLVKPVSPAELLARVRSLQRRKFVRRRAGKRFAFEGWILDPLRRVLSDPSDVLISLSDSEFVLLMIFLERPQMILSRATLLDLTRGEECDAFDRVIDTQVSRLRKRLSTNNSKNYISTIRGEGYRFEPLVELL